MNYTGRNFDFENIFEKELLVLNIGGVFQVSELSVIRSGEIAQHMQLYDEITYVVSGNGEIISNDCITDIKAGQIHFIKRGCSHKIQVSQNENLRYICIAFAPNYENPSVRAFYDECGSREHFIVNDNGTVKSLSEYLIREFYNYDDNSNIMIEQYISQILITLTRILSGKDYVYNKNHCNKSGNYAMYRILRYIDREYIHIKSIKDISDYLSYGEYYISHLFKEKMGITVKKYVNKKKMAYAAELLYTSELTVEQIAEQLGFSGSYTFRRAFKQYIGMTPAEYKKTAIFVPMDSNK